MATSRNTAQTDNLNISFTKMQAGESMKETTIEEMKKILGEHKEELKERYKVKETGIFGSYLRGEQKSGSDLDVLVEFANDANVGLLEFINLENYLSKLLGVKVDLVMKSVLKPRIGKHILKEVVYL
jgi:uncharacterized protein